tara:strand:- start:168 stop:938 length:771 start_codon:yes stop_codon:yes gene_type:complete
MSKLDPQHYDNNSSFQKTIAQEVMSLISIGSTEDILDIGCGDGFLSSKLAEISTKGKVICIDPSEEMVNYASKTYNSIKFPNLTFKTGQAESNHGNNLYSLITAFNCLHWSHDLPKVFKNCFDALKKEGRLLGVTYPEESTYWNMFIEILSRPKWRKYLSISPVEYWLSTVEYRKLASNNQFKTRLFNVDDGVISYNSRKELGQYIKGWLSCMLPLSESKQFDYLEEVLDYAESQFKNKSSIKIPYTKLTFCFEKI